MFEAVVSNTFDAVCLLRSGRVDQSMYCSRLALASVQAAGKESVQEPETTVVAPVKIVSIPIHCDSKNDRSTMDLFHRGFIFEGTNTMANTDENASLCAAMGLYNMGLAMKSKGGEVFLSKAFGIFEKAFSIIRACAPAPTDSTSSLLLATVLNLITCKSELFGYSAAQSWINVYQELFAWATQDPIYEPEEDYEIFASNAVLFSCQQFATAAAA